MSVETFVPRMVPDQIEPAVGWRAWLAIGTPHGGMRLWSIVYPELWRPGQPLVAHCPHHTYRHPISERCTCGIYAAHRREDVVAHLVRPPIRIPARLVVGEVAMWGRVIEGERGLRATHAYPRRLWLLDEDDLPRADLLTPHLAAYGVPVEAGRLRDLD